MRSYRRSEYWIRLSRMSYAALWAALFTALVFFITSLLLGRRVIEQNDVIQTHVVQIREMKDWQKAFGFNRDVIHLPNSYLDTRLPSYVDINLLREDKGFKDFIDGFSMYMFGEVMPAKLLLWLRNDLKDSLKCVYDSKGNPEKNGPKNGETMIGGIADHEGTFVLWPGSMNIDSVWLDQKTVMAWYNDDHGDFHLSKLFREGQRNVCLKLRRKASDLIDTTLKWQINNDRDHEEKDLALFGFSYDGRLAIELDYNYQDINDENKRVYIQNLVFRNTVRKFSACVTSYISSKKKD